MTRTPMIFHAWLDLLALLALVALQGCAETTQPQNSSGSNWLTCEVEADCDQGDAVRCSDDGYCLDADGARIAAAGPDASTRSSSEPNVPPASTPGATAQPRDAGVFGPSSACDVLGAHDPLIPRANETCYDFPVHGQSSSTDTSAYTVARGLETYVHFHYAVPWPAGTVATRYGVVDDSSVAVHAWLASTASSLAPGTVSENWFPGSLPLGTNGRVLAAWAISGCNVALPDDVGLFLPDTGNLVLEWHYLNETGSAQDDRSVFTVCTVPAAERQQVAGLTLLGNEIINATPGISEVRSACQNDSDAPITVLSLEPHMHRTGARITTVIERGGGAAVSVLDEPFQFDARESYLLSPPVVILPGESIGTTCTFNNATSEHIEYGVSVINEMCYQFALAYPLLALDNGVLNLLGATNTCW